MTNVSISLLFHIWDKHKTDKAKLASIFSVNSLFNGVLVLVIFISINAKLVKKKITLRWGHYFKNIQRDEVEGSCKR